MSSQHPEGIRIHIPGRAELQLDHLLLDWNGTIALDGSPQVEVWNRLLELSHTLYIKVITADTFGSVSAWRGPWEVLPLQHQGVQEDILKERLLQEIGPQRAVAIGNGANDALMLKRAALGICVLGPEGAARDALLASDIVVRHIRDALDLLLYPKRLIATLRR